MLVRFVYGHNYWDTQEFDDDTSVDEIEEFYEDWLFNSCLPLELFDTDGMSDEEVDNTLKEYGQWYIMEEE